MKVSNVHQCRLDADAKRVGALIDSLSSADDRLWPRTIWPRMDFDRPLAAGASGGHGPIRYFIEQYVPGASIRFRFTGPKGFDGYHEYEVLGDGDQPTVLRHRLEMNAHGGALLSWPLVYRPLHDALMEDSLALAQASLGLTPGVRPWSLWVKILRWVASGGKARRQASYDRSPAPDGSA